MSRRTVSLSSSSGMVLRGIIHTPTGTAREGQAAILLPGVVGTRVGPHRILVELADRLAEQGWPVLRCDLTGSGYSDGTPPALDQYVDDVRSMMSFLERELGAVQFLLGGVCRGAKIALAAALVEPRASHLVLLTCPRLREESIREKVVRRRRHHLKRYVEKALDLRWVARLWGGDLQLRMIAKALWNPVDVGGVRRTNAESGQYDCTRLAARALFVYGERDPDLEDSAAYYRQQLAACSGQVAFRILGESDQAFYAVRWRRAALDAVNTWLEQSGR